jgi:hypothetical protein
MKISIVIFSVVLFCNLSVIKSECDFKSKFGKLEISKKFKMGHIEPNKNYFRVNIESCIKNISIKPTNKSVYFIQSKFNSIVVDEYVFENKDLAHSFFLEVDNYSDRIRTTDEENIRDICSSEELRWDRFIYAVEKGEHVYLFGYQNETKYPVKSLQYNIENDKRILIDDLVNEFEKLN